MESFEMTSYYAKRIIGDNAAASAASALLQTGVGITTSTWILNQSSRTTDTYGIKYVYDSDGNDDKIEFYGGATASAWIQLNDGAASFSQVTSTTFTGYLNGEAKTAAKWTNDRKIYVALGTASTSVAVNGGASNASAIGIGVDGTLDVAHGGTGATQFTANSAILSGNTTTAALTTRGITDITTAATNPTANTNLITANTLMNYKGTSNIDTVGTITTGTWQATTIAVQYGGTGRTSWNQWGVLYASATAALTNTAQGTNGAILMGKGAAAPAWKASANGAVYATTSNGDLQWGTLPVAQGGTNATSVTKYGIAYGNASANAYTFTAAGSNGAILEGKGDSTAPTWKASANGAVYATTSNGSIQWGTLPVAQGGTNVTSHTGNRLVWSSEDGLSIQGASHYVSSTAIGVKATTASGVNLYVNGTTKLGGDTEITGNVLPTSDKTYNLGSTTYRWSNVYTNVLRLQNASSDPSTSAGARIEFTYDANDGSRAQPVYLSYTPNDNYRSPAGIKVMGGASATAAWFEVEGNLYVPQVNFLSNTNTTVGIMYMSTSATNNIHRANRIFIRQYSYNASTGATLSYTENYVLPEVSSAMTSTKQYDILTSKPYTAVHHSWHKGRDTAYLNGGGFSGDHLYSILSFKTTNGSWDVGAYKNNSYLDKLLFNYIKDDTYNGSTSTFDGQVQFGADRIIIKNMVANSATGNNGYASGEGYIRLEGQDKNSRALFCTEGVLQSNGNVAAGIYTRNYDGSTDRGWKGIVIYEDKSGNAWETLAGPIAGTLKIRTAGTTATGEITLTPNGTSTFGGIIKAIAAGNTYVEAQNSEKGVRAVLNVSDADGIPGLWTNGYWNSTTYVDSNLYLIQRRNDGGIYTGSTLNVPGNVIIRHSTIDLTQSNNGITGATGYGLYFYAKGTTNNNWGRVLAYATTNGNTYLYLQAYNYNGTTGKGWGGFTICENKSGAVTYEVSSPDNFRSAIVVPSTTGVGASGTWGIDISGNAATASALYTGGASSSTSGDIVGAIQAYWNNNKSTIPRNKGLALYSTHSSGSMSFGYFLSGYDSNPYGGFFSALYGTPYYISIKNGTFAQDTILTSANYDSYAVKLDGTNTMTGTLNINKVGEISLAVKNTSTTAAHQLELTVAASGNGGVYDRTAGSWLLYSDLNGVCYINLLNEGRIVVYNHRNKANGGSWDLQTMKWVDNAGTMYANIGTYGSSATMTYMYLGGNAYNGNNFRIYPNGNIRSSAENHAGTNLAAENGHVYIRVASPSPSIRFGMTEVNSTTYQAGTVNDMGIIYYQTPVRNKISNTYPASYFMFREYSYNAPTSSTATRVNFAETYTLPAVDVGRSTNATYQIYNQKLKYQIARDLFKTVRWPGYKNTATGTGTVAGNSLITVYRNKADASNSTTAPHFNITTATLNSAGVGIGWEPISIYRIAPGHSALAISSYWCSGGSVHSGTAYTSPLQLRNTTSSSVNFQPIIYFVYAYTGYTWSTSADAPKLMG